MNNLVRLAGKLCEIILPIQEEFYLGNHNSSIAVCTLSSIDMLKKLSEMDIMNKTFIVGRLFSENTGIDNIVRFAIKNNIKTLILCGKEVWGHKAGHSLISLHRFGIDDQNRIINSTSPEPFVTVTKYEIELFQKQTRIINKINETNPDVICKIINDL